MLAENREDGKDYAIKVLKKQNMSVSDLALFRHEIESLKLCQHPNVIGFHELFEDTKNLFIVMEYLKGGDLMTFMEKNKFKINEHRVAEIIASVAKALIYLHKMGIIHRDVKPDNILLIDDSLNSDVKLADLGLASLFGSKEKCSDKVGTFIYTSPEILLGLPYDMAVDYWNLGMVTYYLLSGKLPFSSDMSTYEKKM